MKPEGAIVIIVLLIIGFAILKTTISQNNIVENTTTEENKVAYRYDIEDQNFADINQNVVEAEDSNANVENVIDVSVIEELRSESY